MRIGPGFLFGSTASILLSLSVGVRVAEARPGAAIMKSVPLYSLFEERGSYYRIEYLRLLAEKSAIRSRVNAQINADLGVGREPCLTARGSEHESSIDHITYLPGRLLSFGSDYGSNCAGAAHPTAGSLGENFDLSSGAKISLAAQFKSGDTRELDALLLRKAKEEASPRLGGCTVRDYEQFGVTAAQFRLTPTNLTVWTELPHIVATCNVNLTIPLADLETSLAAGSLALRLLRGEAR